jgi:Fur family transcriptional regulator, ferric uptake regulator
MSGWKGDTLGALRRAGYRSGGARAAVVELLGEQTCCVTAQEIFDELRERGQRVGVASVYRALDVLVERGHVQRIDLGEGTARYEPAHSDGAHHHHLICDGCGKVDAFEDKRLESAIRNVETRLGYEVAGHEVVLHGACADCRAA